MRVLSSALLSALLCLSLAGACSKQAQPQAPSPAAETEPAPPPVGEATIASGEPAPAPADPGPRPASVTDEDIATADQLVESLEKMANGITAAGSDCPKVAAVIKSMSSDMSAVAKRGNELDEKIASDEVTKKWFEETYASRVMSIMGKVMDHPCFEDRAVQEAMSSIEI